MKIWEVLSFKENKVGERNHLSKYAYKTDILMTTFV